jgi:hypothetical protein
MKRIHKKVQVAENTIQCTFIVDIYELFFSYDIYWNN